MVVNGYSPDEQVERPTRFLICPESMAAGVRALEGGVS